MSSRHATNTTWQWHSPASDCFITKTNRERSHAKGLRSRNKQQPLPHIENERFRQHSWKRHKLRTRRRTAETRRQGEDKGKEKEIHHRSTRLWVCHAKSQIQKTKGKQKTQIAFGSEKPVRTYRKNGFDVFTKAPEWIEKLQYRETFWQMFTFAPKNSWKTTPTLNKL